ncbi:MAG: hypothetical protein FD123_1869 [Bacteroidetes bacterium]|nr:MAG: hypothetical protein FD123_1869 [Bacteroidota bacterium]
MISIASLRKRKKATTFSGGIIVVRGTKPGFVENQRSQVFYPGSINKESYFQNYVFHSRVCALLFCLPKKVSKKGHHENQPFRAGHLWRIDFADYRGHDEAANLLRQAGSKRFALFVDVSPPGPKSVCLFNRMIVRNQEFLSFLRKKVRAMKPSAAP